MRAKFFSISTAGLLALALGDLASSQQILVNGEEDRTLQLESVTVTPDGSVVRIVTADTSGGGGEPPASGGESPAGGGETPGDGDPSGDEDGSPGDDGTVPASCGDLPDNVTIVDAGSLADPFPAKSFQGEPDQIFAFRVTVPARGARPAAISIAKTSGAKMAKLISVSKCPGRVDLPLDDQATTCAAVGVETSSVNTHPSRTAHDSYCKVQPGDVLYVNAFSTKRPNSTALTCSSSRDCGFYFSVNPW